MGHVTEWVDAAYLEQRPPRRLPQLIIVNLLGSYLFERPLKAMLNPPLLIASAAAVALYALGLGAPLWIIPLLLVAARLVSSTYRVGQRIRDDAALLRNGVLVKAHVLRLRPYRNKAGQIEGALIDCAIPVAERRTYLGSIWLSDGSEAMRLAKEGHVEVICLPRTPGTWRVTAQIGSEVRYERMGAVQRIPTEG